MNEFFEKYKHPKWQKKRLEKLNECEFICENCGDNESTLNVHHKYYIQGNNPWEYENDELSVLCDDCHKLDHEYKDYFQQNLNNLRKHFSHEELFLILDAILGEYEGSDDCQFSSKDCIVKGVRSGLLLDIGESLTRQEMRAIQKLKGKYEK